MPDVPPPSPVPSPPLLPQEAAGLSVPDLLVALGVTLLGGLLLLGSLQIPFGINAVVGPRAFPLIVSVGLTALGMLLTVNVLRGGRAEPAAEEDTDLDAPVHLSAAGIILGGFLLGAVLLPTLGFVGGTAIMYFSVAYAFGERRLPLMLGVALAVALVTYLVFTRGLGLSLPPGVLKGAL
ncbi:tripartite tricarboxylate transporter TctB family protein [Deinococcus hopiensis]|uniref:Putative tricarboxylic transport membrane protein n=1 Tax=Deinococcus hopiensis KR-140 TaxID=695939 RepID=A0A1W1VHP0_9DEIO|nr:tripartite tricarboxylate transporter TctB family protein [Deinococcus hopiensis]SMB92895.1 putative tricarboxylic transport membrane protein [Deinococcus hopiensis KR-140]